MKHILELNMVCIQLVLGLTNINRILDNIVCMLYQLVWWLRLMWQHLENSFLVMEHKYLRKFGSEQFLQLLLYQLRQMMELYHFILRYC